MMPGIKIKTQNGKVKYRRLKMHVINYRFLTGKITTKSVVKNTMGRGRLEEEGLVGEALEARSIDGLRNCYG
jgi:hypothetical protein